MSPLLLLISFLTAFLDLGFAVPVWNQERAISADLLNTLSLYEQYSAAAYCPANNEAGSSTVITCEAGNCPLVQAADAQSVLEFENVGASDATGFVSVDPANKIIVISFRGSRSVQNWITNLIIEFVSWDICSGCKAHKGWLASWQSVKPQVVAALSTAKAANPSYKIVATGHSLGGALATLAAADLRASAYTVDLYTYGSPMVGNVQLATFITGQTTANFRVTHTEDIVPKLPGYVLGYAHVSPEYWITSGNNVNVTANDIQVSTGVIDLSGNGGTLGLSVDDHLWYFNSIAACGSD